ncbi:unnamed protein product [marine sediment metagenome]|uniref:Uncharacterized protein n=1 Tax=marine sediment metagenome TaxID=412755 RepID=X1VXL4_9ZZZZ
MDNNDKFKLITRRYIAWGLGGLATATLVFVVVWSQITGAVCPECGGNEMASVAIGGLIAIVSGVIGFYFSREKVKGE